MDRPADITESSWRKLCELAEHDPIIDTALNLIRSDVMPAAEALATCMVVQAEKQRFLVKHALSQASFSVPLIVIAE